MKALVAALALAGLGLATPAQALVVEVTTSVAVNDRADRAELRQALESAVNTVLHDAIAFTPTMVVLTQARLVGDRLWVHLLIADEEGEHSLRPPDEETPSEPDDASPAEGRVDHLTAPDGPPSGGACRPLVG